MPFPTEYLLADLDPNADETSDAAKARYLAALENFKPKPTAVVNSGNGIQVLWKLAEPILLEPPVLVEKKVTKNSKTTIELVPEFRGEDKKKIADAEGRSAVMMTALGSVAGTQNIDRILRLPGTTNLPNKKKIKDGRVACQTKPTHFNGAAYSPAAFPLPEPSEIAASVSNRILPEMGNTATLAGETTIDALPVSTRIKNLIRGIDDPEHPYTSRSEAVFAVIIAMAAADCSNEQIEAVVLDPDIPISAHVLEQPKPAAYLARQIAKARKVAVDPDVAKLNEKYALVLVGDKAAVMITSRDDIRFLTLSAFDHWFENEFVQYETAEGPKKVPLAKHWRRHPQRRQYEGVIFAPKRDVPGYFNLWKGFAIEPRAGDCSKFLAHLKDNVCQGNESLHLWVVGWFAQIVQYPDAKIGTSIVLRGKMGVGKTKVGQVIGRLLGEHYALVSDPRYVTGRFNSHLVSCLLLHCDEAFWAGDHAAEGKLKDLITGDYQFIEFKGKEPIRVRNYVRLLVTGNPDWLVPAGFEERRFAVLDVGEDHMEDHPYFAAIDAEMDDGGREALLDYLLHFDLKSVDLRTIPKTAALLDQKLSSLTPEQGWWLDTLVRGELPWGIDEPGRCPASRLFDRYVKHAQRHGTRRRAIETQLGFFLRKSAPGSDKTKGTYRDANGNDRVGTIYVFPPLDKCREAFAQALKQKVAWPEAAGWSTEPVPDPDPEGAF